MLLSRLSRQNGCPVLWIRRAFCPGPVFNGDSLSTGVAVVLPWDCRLTKCSTVPLTTTFCPSPP